jgi:hypothetical protein
MRKEQSMPKKIRTVLLFAAALVFVALCSGGNVVAQDTTPFQYSFLGTGQCYTGEDSSLCFTSSTATVPGITIEVMPDANENWPSVLNGIVGSPATQTCPPCDNSGSPCPSCRQFRYRVTNNTESQYTGNIYLLLHDGIMADGITSSGVVDYLLGVYAEGSSTAQTSTGAAKYPGVIGVSTSSPLTGVALVTTSTTGCTLASPVGYQFLQVPFTTTPLGANSSIDISIYGVHTLPPSALSTVLESSGVPTIPPGYPLPAFALADSGINCSSSLVIQPPSGSCLTSNIRVPGLLNLSATGTQLTYKSSYTTTIVTVDYDFCNNQVKDVYTPPGPLSSTNAWTMSTPMWSCMAVPASGTSTGCYTATSFGNPSGVLLDVQVSATPTYASYFCVGKVCYYNPNATY